MENKKQLMKCVEFVAEELDADIFLYSAEITDFNALRISNSYCNKSLFLRSLKIVMALPGCFPRCI